MKLIPRMIGTTVWSSIKLVFALLPGLVAIGLSQVAQATPITYNFSGTINTVDPALTSYIPVGTSYTGSFQLDDAVPDSSAFANHAQYLGAAIAGSVTIGGVLISFVNGAAQVQPPPSYNLFNIVAGSAFGLGGTLSSVGLPAGWSTSGWNFQLASSAGTAFSSFAIPNSAVLTNLSLFDNVSFTLVLSDGVHNHLVFGSIDDVASAANVPEPGTVTLLALGIVGLGFARRKKV